MRSASWLKAARDRWKGDGGGSRDLALRITMLMLFLLGGLAAVTLSIYDDLTRYYQNEECVVTFIDVFSGTFWDEISEADRVIPGIEQKVYTNTRSVILIFWPLSCMSLLLSCLLPMKRKTMNLIVGSLAILAIVMWIGRVVYDYYFPQPLLPAEFFPECPAESPVWAVLVSVLLIIPANVYLLISIENWNRTRTTRRRSVN